MRRKPTAFSTGGGLIVRRLLLVIAVGVLGALFVAPKRQRRSGDSEMGIVDLERKRRPASALCRLKFGSKEEVHPESAMPEPAGQCKGSTSEKLFTQAGGHPNYGITDFKIDTYPSFFGLGGFPTSFLKDITVETRPKA